MIYKYTIQLPRELETRLKIIGAKLKYSQQEMGVAAVEAYVREQEERLEASVAVAKPNEREAVLV
jgi:predicted transcriptional regulator